MAVQKKGAAKKTAPKAVAPKAAPKAVAKTATKRSKPIKAAAPVKDMIETTTIDAMVAPATRLMGAGADQAREALARATAASEQIRQTMTETAAVGTTGALELNGKVLAAWRAQGEIALDLWRQTLAAGSVSEAVRVQTSGARQAYESATAHWKDVAETATRLFGTAVKPMTQRVG